MENPNFQKLNLSNFPYEVLFNILLNAEPKDIANYCQTSKRASQICKEQDFWRAKLWKDYGKEEPMKDMTWRQQYQLRRIKVVNSPITTGEDYYGIIDDQGNLYMAGNNEDGQLGDGSFISSRVLKRVPLESKVISVDTSGNYGMKMTGAVTEEGEVYIWGDIGNIIKGMPLTNSPRKFNLPGKAVKFIGTKYQKSYAIIMEDGSIYLKRYVGEEIMNTRLDSGRKIVDAILSNEPLYINKIEYTSYLYVLDNHGDVYFFYTDTRVPLVEKYKVKINFPDRIKQLSGGKLGVALSVKGEVYTWGKNDQSQLGIQNDQSEEFVFIASEVYKVNLPVLIESISGGYKNVAAITKSGTVYAWGAGRNNNIIGYSEKEKLADNTSDAVLRMLAQLGVFPSPMELKITSKITFISLGDLLSIAVTEDGMVNYWGDNQWGPKNPYLDY